MVRLAEDGLIASIAGSQPCSAALRGPGESYSDVIMQLAQRPHRDACRLARQDIN